MLATEVDFHSREVIQDPWPLFSRLMADDPAHWNGRLGAFCLTRHADVIAAFKDPRFSSDRIRPFVQAQRRVAPEIIKPLGDVLSLWAVFNDPPMHTRLRKLLNKGFTPRVIADLRGTVQELVDELIAELPREGDIDFLDAFAAPLPARVIAHILGVPRDDIPRLKAWSDDIAGFVLVSRTRAAKYELAAKSLLEMCAYFEELIAARRAAPGERVIDQLITAHEDDDALSLPELVSSCVLLLFAGHETTTHFVANGLWSLLTHPEACAELRARPDDATLLGSAMDEILRWEGPSIMQLRVLAEDVEAHGTTMKAGQRVMLFNAAANRDPRVFSEPDRFDIHRADVGRHTAFGHGIHFCLGAFLARLEGAVAFPALLERLRSVELLEPRPEWSDSLVIRGMNRMPLRIALA